MILQAALPLAEKLVTRFAPYCERIEIAGSVRRGKQEVGDIEIVAIPRAENDLFGAPAPIYPIHSYIHDGEKAGDWRKTKGGLKYVQLALTEGINLDLFLVTPPAQWGVLFTIRTGPADFSQWIVTPRNMGGCLPSNARVQDGRVLVNARPLPMPEEIDFFDFLGLGWIPAGVRRPGLKYSLAQSITGGGYRVVTTPGAAQNG
jgi:DNA polymerase/3'-5' exonuclease PolX